MQIPAELRPPCAPLFFTSHLPEAERPFASAIRDNLQDLEKSSTDLSHSLALFDFCAFNMGQAVENGGRVSRDDVWIPWQFMAARYGGLSIRNWGQALAAVQGLLGKASTLLSQIDAKALGDIRKDFDALFPNIDKLRHSIAHPEFYANPNKKAKMAAGNVTFELDGLQLEGVQSLTMQSNLFGRTFAATFEGVAVKYDLSAETALEMVGLTKRAFEVFQGATEQRSPSQAQ